MEHTLMDYVSSSEPDGDAFICAECGDGFTRYLDLLKHLTIHQRLRIHERTDSFPLVGLPNGFQIPREYALHENGTFIVVDRSGQSNNPASVKQPTSTPSPNQNAKPIALISKSAKTDTNTESPSQHPSVSPLKQYRCETCGKSFNNQLSVQRHQQYRNLEQGFKCTLCCKIFPDKERLREHLKEHAHERFYCCGHCGKRFLKRETLYSHQKERHRVLGHRKKSDNGQENTVHKTYPCKNCKLCFFWLSDLQSHLLSHSKDKILSMNTSITKQSLKDEKSDTTGYSNSTPTDVIKQYDSSNPTDVTKQYDSSTPPDVTEQYSTGTSTDMTKITREYNNGTPTEVTRQCSSDAAIDVKTLSDKSDSKTPSSFRPYRCGLCGDRFQQLIDLKEHHLTHQTQEEIDKLKKESETQRVVKRRRRYTGIECIVTQAPARKGGRPPLYKKGSGAKVHPCKHCHRVFSHSSSLSRHNRYHKGTLHTCVLCGKHFPQRCDVRRHIAMYHKPELEKKPNLKYLALHSKPEGGSKLNSDMLEKNVFHKNPKRSLQNIAAELCSVNGEEQQSIAIGEASTFARARGNYKCEECGKKFGLLCVYQRHLRYHKREPGNEMVKCPRCPIRFRGSSALERHLENHPSQSGGETDMEGQVSPTVDSNHDPDLDSDHDNVEDLEGQGDIDKGEKAGPAEVLYECTECTETFSSLQKFLKHQSSHGSDNLG